MSEQRRSLSPEFKLDVARLVVDRVYSISEASRSLDVGTTVICRGSSDGCFGILVAPAPSALKSLLSYTGCVWMQVDA